MSLPLLHTPADVLRRLLIALGLGADPPAEPWPVYWPAEPQSPDDTITVRDTAPRDFGSVMFDGSRSQHYGVLVRVRASGPRPASQKAYAIADALDRQVHWSSVTIGGTSYCVQSVNRQGGVIDLGAVPEARGRNVLTINALVALTEH